MSDEADKNTPTERPRPRRRRRGRIGFWPVLWGITAGLLFTLTFMSVSGRPLDLPGWARDRVAARLAAVMPDGGVRLDRIQLLVDDDGRPRIRLSDVEITDGSGVALARLNEVRATVSPLRLIRGDAMPASFEFSGAQITLRRATDGAFTLDFDGVGGGTAGASIADMLATLDRLFGSGALSRLEAIEASDVTIILEDARSGRIWQATGGTLAFSNVDAATSVTVRAEVFNGTEDLADVQISMTSPHGTGAAEFGLSFENAASADIALQSPALSFLTLLDAPISGAMRGSVDADGRFGDFAATLEIGQGSLRPLAETTPVAFDAARAYLTFSPDRDRVDFSELSVTSDRITARGSGHLYLDRGGALWPERLMGQLRLSDVNLAPGDLLPAPVVLNALRADLRLSIEPFGLEIGQMVVDDGGAPRHVSGSASVGPEGWTFALDLATPSLTPARLLDYWPETVTPGVRRWIAANVIGGRIEDVEMYLRKEAGQRARAAFGFAMHDGEARLLRHFPAATGIEGRASLVQGRFALAFEAGEMVAEGFPPVDLAGSSFVIPDVGQRPGQAEVALNVAGPVPTVLSLMNNRPFRVLEAAGQPPDFLSAEARISADIAFPLKRQITPSDVVFRAGGRIQDARAERLVPERVLKADDLSLDLTNSGIEVSGEVMLDDVPLSARWQRGIGTGSGESSVLADVAVTRSVLESFGVALPDGAYEGAARAEVNLALAPDAPPTFRATSDLTGASLAIPALGWRKPAAEAGRFEIEGRFGPAGTPPEVERIVLSAPGLAAEGIIGRSDTGEAVLDLSAVRAGNWLDAPVRVVLRGAGVPPEVAIRGGEIDLRRLPDFVTARGAGGPLRLDLEALRVSDDIVIRPFSASLSTAGGLEGRFEGRVNGRTPVTGAVLSVENGVAVRVLSDRGGDVLEDIGAAKGARDGAMELVLTPKQTPGAWDGQLKISDLRLEDAPVLAGLLDAVSIVGLLDELQGPGLLFATTEARFDLTPERLVIREGAAIGASLGISFDGVYERGSKSLDMQGVVSPIYLLNGIGRLVSRRSGEGLFGFNFRVSGTPGATQVQVNPLSILTPGMFRDIFRRPLPDPVE